MEWFTPFGQLGLLQGGNLPRALANLEKTCHKLSSKQGRI